MLIHMAAENSRYKVVKVDGPFSGTILFRIVSADGHKYSAYFDRQGRISTYGETAPAEMGRSEITGDIRIAIKHTVWDYLFHIALGIEPPQ